LTVLNSYLGRDFSIVNTDFRDELNLGLQQFNLLLLLNQKTLPQFITKITLNISINNPFLEVIGTNFIRNDYLSNCCLFNYNTVLYCYIYDNIDFPISFKNKLEVLQCLNLQKL
jgi:hypothetical protein